MIHSVCSGEQLGRCTGIFGLHVRCDDLRYSHLPHGLIPYNPVELLIVSPYCVRLTSRTTSVVPLATFAPGATNRSVVPFIYPGESGSFVNKPYSAQDKESFPRFPAGIVRVCFAPLLRFRFSVSAPACTDTSLRSPPPPDSENRCAFRLGVFGRAVTSAGLLKRECPGSDMPSRSNNSRVFRWD